MRKPPLTRRAANALQRASVIMSTTASSCEDSKDSDEFMFASEWLEKLVHWWAIRHGDIPAIDAAEVAAGVSPQPGPQR